MRRPKAANGVPSVLQGRSVLLKGCVLQVSVRRVYSIEKGSTVCKPCAPGKYQSAVGSAICLDCDAGKHNNVSGAVDEAMCVACVPGKYSSYPGQKDCDQCPDGYFAPFRMDGTPPASHVGLGTRVTLIILVVMISLTSNIQKLEDAMIEQGGALWVAFVVTGIFMSMAGFMTFTGKTALSKRLPTSPGSKLYTTPFLRLQCWC